MIEGWFRHTAHVVYRYCFSSVFSFSFCVRPCGQIEQLACSRSITLHGLSDQAVTLDCLPVDKHTLVATHTLVHTGVLGVVSLCCRFCLGSGAESRGMFPWHGPAGRGLGRLVTHMAVSLHLYLSECFLPSHTLAVLLPRFSPAVTTQCRHKQAMTIQSHVSLQSTTRFGHAICWCHVLEAGL